MNANKPISISPLAEGQMVIIIARWVLILASILLILADTQSVSFNVIRFEIMIVLALAVSNFALVAQVLTKRKPNELVTYGMSLADLMVITTVIIVQGGFESGVYTFYFPALLAFALTFPMIELYLFLGGTVCVYSFISLFTMHDVNDVQTLLVRVLMLTAVAGCANYFAQVERNRRNTILRNRLVGQQISQENAEASPAAMPPMPVH